MKKAITILLVLLMTLSLVACGDDSEQTNVSNSTNEQQTNVSDSTDEQQTNVSDSTDEQQTENEEPSSPQDIIEKTIRDRIEEKYTYSEIDEITINDNLGTDTPDDYIALVNITWTQKNSGKTSKEVLKMYSDDLAATLAQHCENVQELAVFWTVPYLNNASAKCSYERKDGGMYVMDLVWDNAFNS